MREAVAMLVKQKQVRALMRSKPLSGTSEHIWLVCGSFVSIFHRLYFGVHRKKQNYVPFQSLVLMFCFLGPHLVLGESTGDRKEPTFFVERPNVAGGTATKTNAAPGSKLSWMCKPQAPWHHARCEPVVDLKVDLGCSKGSLFCTNFHVEFLLSTLSGKSA